MNLLALVCGLLVLWSFVSLMSAPEYHYPQSFAAWADARTSRLARAMVCWSLGVMGLVVLAIRACV